MRVAKQNAGFTLIELILVMGVLATLAAITAPHLSGFTRGREFDGEWNRFLSILRYARNEAISRSTPVELRFDTTAGSYRLNGSYWFDPLPSYAADHLLPKGLAFQFAGMGTGIGTTVATSTQPASRTGLSDDGVSAIFQPDGSVDTDSPTQIQLVEGGGTSVRTVQLDPVLGYKPVTGE